MAATIDPDKLAAQAQWNASPCGTGDYLDAWEPESLPWFEEVRRYRYDDTDPWITRVLPFVSARGRRVLEIGHGLGSDLLTFSEHGAEVHGIDLTAEHHRLAERNFALHGRTAELVLGDAAHLPWPDASFDSVYSIGVLHHTPDTVRCIGEAYRVLKPKGQLILALYHRWSAFHLFGIVLHQGLVRGDLRRLGYRGLLATVERGADGLAVRPLVKTYSRGQLRTLLADFSTVRLTAAHFKREHLPFGRFLPRAVEPLLEPLLGWYVVAFATK